MSDKPSFGRDAGEFLKQLETVGASEENKACATRIVSLAPSGSERVTVRVLVSNPSGSETVEFLIMGAHAEELGLHVGEIEEELLPELEYYAEVAKAFASACSSFAYTQSSLAALSKKLLQKGFAKDVCDDAMTCLRKSGLVKEDEIALRRAQIFVSRLWGRTRIVMKLREEGFHGEVLSLAEGYLDEVDFAENCKKLIAKRFGGVSEDDHKKKLMIASLTRMGYSASDIKKAINE